MRLEDLKGRQLGRYEILEVLGRGGMAAVYRARDTVLRRDVALKVLYPHYTGDVALVERFQREAVLAAGLDHPNILPIYDVGDADGLVYIAMRLLSGKSFADVLRLRGALAPAEVFPLLDQVAAALDYAHARQIVHRDIKPANILIEGDELGALAGARAILTDFGIAKSLDSAARGLTATGVLIGTPEYMAPEQIRGGHTVDARADIYALGVVAYRALTGQRPFDGSTEEVLMGHLHGTFAPPSAVNASLPPALDDVMRRAMAREPAQRYQSAGEFARALRSAASLDLPTPPPAHRQFGAGRVVVPAVAAADLAGTNVPQVTRQGNAAPRRVDMAAPPPAARPLPQRSDGGNAAAWVLLGLILALVIGGGGLYAAGLLFPRDAVALPATSILPTVPLATLQPTVPLLATDMPPSPVAAASATAAPAPSAKPSAQIPPTPVPTKAPAKTPTIAPSAVPATPTPTLAPTAAPSAVPATATPTVTPTVTPGPTAIGGEFSTLLNNRPALSERLGCADQARQERIIAEQSFERGTMLWVAGTQGASGTIYVIVRGEAQTTRIAWQSFEDTWREGDPEDSGDRVPPAGLVEPIRGFGRLWYANTAISEALGWANSQEVAGDGVVQHFAHGKLIYSPLGFGSGAATYVLYQDGTFEVYPA